MIRHCIIDTNTNLVVNIIEYEAAPETPPAGFSDGIIAVVSSKASIDWTYADGVFTEPQPYPSWTLVSNVWKPPTARPSNNGWYDWDEETQAWVDAGNPKP
jgi:hypothetical protein